MYKQAFHPATLRKTVLEMAYAGSSVHIPSAFSIIEILAVLYRSHLRLGDRTPKAPGRDFLVLSKGHGVMAQYACLHELGWLHREDIDRYFGNGTRLKGLADAHVPGVEATSGSLGHGLSVGVGLALAARKKRTDQRCYAIVGDGEMNEGPIWEALLFAAQFRLDNLFVIVDENRLQAMGSTREVMQLGDLQAKFGAFDFDVRGVDGHDEAALDRTFSDLKSVENGRPKAVIARTIKGKGVSFMENVNSWHYTRLNEATYRAALRELDQA